MHTLTTLLFVIAVLALTILVLGLVGLAVAELRWIVRLWSGIGRSENDYE